MIRRLWVLALVAAIAAAQPKTLDIFWIDVEGGGATLIVTPQGQSLLVDTGNPTPDDRDAKRIMEAVKQAGLKKLDYLLITHYHGDHVGGVPALAKMIPIDHFLDHGDSIEAGTPAGAKLWADYEAASKGKRTVLKPGDKLPLKGLDAIVVASNGVTIAKPINGGGAANPYCAGAETKPADTTENQRSAGFLLTWNKFKFLDLGDLTWDKEMELACPANKLGTVTLYQATHHGFVRGFSGAPAHVLALQPQVVVVNDGPRKGWDPGAFDVVQKIKGLEGVWQIHQALASDAAHNVDPKMIANQEETAQCQGHWLKASVEANGNFTLTNSRTGFSKSYTAR
ncbi:MAG TPA: MBL fold metallo-hydrolase [Bryobacteraceae bacterium]|nr:MBL fold metallo-hydrolase [Bryobacteraceae bacterium]